ncbi:GspE/PulE family protein [Tenacibaculum jejuense]|uniref:Type II secretory pathway, ATPase PulE/Tfp pilus assembly pathway, ATPase PilB n=1 Tax=Tenacibaculum jejuense TaxID=584609 RepID=A0A238U8G1_9FLAO|nr:GspE/PulE family protein [Tenacibaculum jejuense]SNR15447.1 Type II secretory pathway, ATPase PulE/Tfp pilus assembly pathway, ATPase PilB [Tenacibaculum jejuense]
MKEKKYDLATDLVQLITSELAYEYRIIPKLKTETEITFLTDTEDSVELKNELEIVLGSTVNLEQEEKEIINKFLLINYRKRNTQTSTLSYSDDFLLNIIHEAKEIGSSDIHFEAFEEQNKVRFRIDGKLIEKYLISLDEYPKIVNRLKIMSGMDISEKRLPQDGRINITTAYEDFDIRVSSLPTLHGEKLVLRILSKNNVAIQLDKLGFTLEELQSYKKAVKKPNGIILISGPTGSGKTTTLYATLKELNKEDTNILTIEDPIEYTLEGVNQVQLKEDIGLDFASTLKTFLRQDPDIIMVGEIRDVATANMAIRAALTGHLVLSTIHTNSAWGTVSRLIDMGVPSFLIASTLNVSIAQRLVRKLCDHCKVEVAVNEEDVPEEILENKLLKTHYKAVGCEHCYQTGYKGRKAVYEIIPVTKPIEKAIKKEQSEIDEYLTENGINTLKVNALDLVKRGITSIDEVYSLLIS